MSFDSALSASDESRRNSTPSASGGLWLSTDNGTSFASVFDSQPTQAIGSYAKGCLAGGQPLPLDGPHWQVMRLSRNRNWGTPRLIDYLEKFSDDVATLDGWPGRSRPISDLAANVSGVSGATEVAVRLSFLGA